MCELFALSARWPATVQLSLGTFAQRGGRTGPHRDGWGVAWSDGGDVRLLKEVQPAADSACERFLHEHPFATTCAISHVRKATRGAVALRNCQPFMRELGGRWHVFAHNGDLGAVADDATAAPWQGGPARPVGETDSEHAFCELLRHLAPLWAAGAVPPLAARQQVVQRLADDWRGRGPANFVYADGDALFAHGDRRHQPDGRISPPGLWWLQRHCAADAALVTDGLRIDAGAAEQAVLLLASVPLTDEGWRPLARGDLLVVRAGERVPSAGQTMR